MNITVVDPILLPHTGVVYLKLISLLQSIALEPTWTTVNVKVINCTQPALRDEIIRSFAQHLIPISITNHLEQPRYPKCKEFIIGDEFNLDAIKGNRSSPRVYFVSSKVELRHSIAEVRGKVLIILWRTGEMLCKNALVTSTWLDANDAECHSETRRNSNPRTVTVYVEPDMYSFAEEHEGVLYLTGFKAMLLYELEKYLNVKFKYSMSSNSTIVTTSAFRRWQTFIKPLRGVTLGRVNDSLTLIQAGDDV